MGNAAELPRMTVEEFLEWDRTQTVRHEFVDGEVYAMTGAGAAHNTMAGNLYLALRSHLAGSACRTFMTDMKLMVAPVGNFYYPDIIVTCSAADVPDPYIVREPTLLIEVLSPSTERYDRGDKFRRYRLLPSLQEYVLVDLEARSVDIFRKDNQGRWFLQAYGAEAGITLSSVELEIGAAALWHEVPVIARTPPADR